MEVGGEVAVLMILVTCSGLDGKRLLGVWCLVNPIADIETVFIRSYAYSVITLIEQVIDQPTPSRQKRNQVEN
jgi:hypothetical protein